MACEIKTWYTIIFTMLVILNMESLVLSESQVPCYFIFGDSLVDSGNNNALRTTAKADHSPYGIDFRDGPTGRFTNGRTIADFIAEFLGFDNYIPPFATVKDEEILKGVNYGSGGAGIRDDTGRQTGGVISLNKQLLNHQTTITRMTHLQGGNKATTHEYLSKCLYHVGIGSNDYINNYLMPKSYDTSRLYSPDKYAEILIQQYSDQLKALYNNGARKVAVFSIGPVGVTPQEVKLHGYESAANINNQVELFNGRLKHLIDDLNKNLPNAKFIYIDTSSLALGITQDDFKVVTTACCKTSSSTGQCISEEALCSNRNDHFFFDDFHPTEHANNITATRAFKSHQPTNIYQLVQLK